MTQRTKGWLARLMLCLGAVPVAAQSDAADDDELAKCRETNRILRAEVANLRAALAAANRPKQETKNQQPLPSDPTATLLGLRDQEPASDRLKNAIDNLLGVPDAKPIGPATPEEKQKYSYQYFLENLYVPPTAEKGLTESLGQPVAEEKPPEPDGEWFIDMVERLRSAIDHMVGRTGDAEPVSSE